MADDTSDDDKPLFTPEEVEDSDKSLLTRTTVTVVLRKPVDTAHGVRLVPSGKPLRVTCDVEGRQNQAGMFANSGAQDVPLKSGGLTEITPIQIIARAWPGDLYSAVWYEGDLYDTVGAPVKRSSGTDRSRHWELRAERKRIGVPEPEGAVEWDSSA